MTTSPKPRPTVAVIVPVFNAAAYVREALESVLAQTYGHTELLVVDDGSTDGSAEIAEAVTGVPVLRQPHLGSAAARNVALACCTADIVAFQDADDLWLPTKTERQVEYLLAHPDEPCCTCSRIDFLDPSVADGSSSWCAPAVIDVPLVSYATGTLVSWRSLFLEVGDFDTSYRIAHDTDWMARVRARGHQLGVVDEVLYRRRIHATNLCADQTTMSLELFRVYRAQARRHREARGQP